MGSLGFGSVTRVGLLEELVCVGVPGDGQRIERVEAARSEERRLKIETINPFSKVRATSFSLITGDANNVLRALDCRYIIQEKWT